MGSDFNSGDLVWVWHYEDNIVPALLLKRSDDNIQYVVNPGNLQVVVLYKDAKYSVAQKYIYSSLEECAKANEHFATSIKKVYE